FSPRRCPQLRAPPAVGGSAGVRGEVGLWRRQILGLTPQALLLPRQERSSRRTGLLTRPDGSGEPSYMRKLPAGVIYRPHSGAKRLVEQTLSKDKKRGLVAPLQCSVKTRNAAWSLRPGVRFQSSVKTRKVAPNDLPRQARQRGEGSRQTLRVGASVS